MTRIHGVGFLSNPLDNNKEKRKLTKSSRRRRTSHRVQWLIKAYRKARYGAPQLVVMHNNRHER